MSDIELNNRLRSGDEAAFEYIFKNYYSRLMGFVRIFIDDNIYAEDLVQNVFTSLWLKRENLDVEKSISLYLMKMTKNACLDHIKHQIVVTKYTKELIRTDIQQLYYIDFLEDKTSPSLENDLNNSISALIETMPEKCKIVFKMRWIEGLKNRDISKKLKISTTMVEKHLAKGITIIKNNYKRPD